MGEGGAHLLEERRDALVPDESLIDQMCRQLVERNVRRDFLVTSVLVNERKVVC